MKKASEVMNTGTAKASDFSLIVGASTWSVSSLPLAEFNSIRFAQGAITAMSEGCKFCLPLNDRGYKDHRWCALLLKDHFSVENPHPNHESNQCTICARSGRFDVDVDAMT